MVTSPLWFASNCIGAGFLACAHPKSSNCGFPLSSKIKIALEILFEYKLLDIDHYTLEVEDDWRLLTCLCWDLWLMKFFSDKFSPLVFKLKISKASFHLILDSYK